MMSTRNLAAAAIVVLVLALAGCGGTQPPEVTPAPTAVEGTAETADATPNPEPEPSPTETAAVESEPTTGTREAPLAIGESRKLSDVSAWTLTLVASNLDAGQAIASTDEFAPQPAEGETFVLGTFSVAVDGPALTAQGIDLTNEGVDPWLSLTIEYVAADGTSFGGLTGTSCYTSSMLYSQGAVYQDGAVVTGDVCYAVPTDKVAGGLWRVSNMQNDNVWMSAS